MGPVRRSYPRRRHGERFPIRALAPLLLAVGLGFPGPLRAIPRGTTIPLECRLAEGPWQPCRMEVEQVGTHWFLLVGNQRLEFRHDGRGAVTLQEQGSWRPVSSHWEQDTSLCWDGVCTRGDIPLD